MQSYLRGSLVAAAFGLTLAAAAPASALPAQPQDLAAVASSSNDLRTDVRWRGGYYRGGWRGGYYGRGAGVGLGIASGLVIGSALAAPYYYGPPAYAYPPTVYAEPGGDADGYCAQRYRSYDPASGTYLGYDGQRHPCP